MSERHDRTRVLLVDDEVTTQRLVERALRRAAPQAQVQCASNGVEALQVLARDPVDLLITTLTTPVLDGVELLHHVAKRGLIMPVIVVGGHGASTDDVPSHPGAIEYLADPVDVDALVGRAQALLMAPAHGPDGGIGLLDLVELVGRARRTCTLRVTGAHAHGVLHFTSGSLVDAVLGDQRGAAAALEILSWQATSVRFDPFLRARSTTIETTVARLLQDARGPAEPPPLPADGGVVLPLIPVPAKRSPAATPMPAPSLAPSPDLSPDPPGSPSAPWERADAGEKIADMLADVMTIEGALGAAISVWELDLGLAAVGPRGEELARSGGCRVMRALLTTMTRLDLQTNVQDVLITLDDELHILAPLTHHGDLSLAVAIDGARGNLAMARRHVQKLVRDVVL